MDLLKFARLLWLLQFTIMLIFIFLGVHAYFTGHFDQAVHHMLWAIFSWVVLHFGNSIGKPY